MTVEAPRIPPVEPPYEPDIDTMLKKWMPPNSDAEPLKLFRTLAVHPELTSRMRPLGAGILGHGVVDARERELVIHRTCARCGAEYEWGVHAAGLAARSGLSRDTIAGTRNAAVEARVWSARERVLIRVADALHDNASIDDAQWVELARGWREEQILEILVVAGFYHLVSFSVNALALEPEPWAERFPA